MPMTSPRPGPGDFVALVISWLKMLNVPGEVCFTGPSSWLVRSFTVLGSISPRIDTIAMNAGPSASTE